MREAAAGRDRRGACGDAPLGSGDGRRVLAADVGQGTTDILLTVPGEPLENAVRLVIPSRTQVVAREIRAATDQGLTVVFAGPVMGGGPSGAAMKRHLAAGLRFIAGESAALTFDDDLDRVRAVGVEVVPDDEAEDVGGSPHSVAIHSGDLDPAGLRDALERMGADPQVDAVCIAAQDHGFSPHGSNRAFRFSQWRAVVDDRRTLAELFYLRSTIPHELTRLHAASDLAAELGGDGDVLAADTGPAALYGVLEDKAEDRVLVNVGNGHVVCAVTLGGRVAGVFEHHTARLDGPGLESRLHAFLAGELTSEAVREDGGHGAVLAHDAPRDLARSEILVTGPRRELLRDSDLQLIFAAPHGDMMLTGCYGLLRAFEEVFPAAASPASGRGTAAH